MTEVRSLDLHGVDDFVDGRSLEPRGSGVQQLVCYGVERVGWGLKMLLLDVGIEGQYE